MANVFPHYRIAGTCYVILIMRFYYQTRPVSQRMLGCLQHSRNEHQNRHDVASNLQRFLCFVLNLFIYFWSMSCFPWCVLLSIIHGVGIFPAVFLTGSSVPVVRSCTHCCAYVAICWTESRCRFYLFLHLYSTYVNCTGHYEDNFSLKWIQKWVLGVSRQSYYSVWQQSSQLSQGRLTISN